jgi:serine O-acetyltransferase
MSQPRASRFRMDVARWIIPSQIAEPSEVTLVRTLGLLLHHIPLRAMAWFRVGSWLHGRHVRVIPSIIQRRLLVHYGLELSVGADIGGGLYIAHPVGCTLIAETMGENISVIAAVTIGMRNELRWPRIGDRVFIGAGARVLGNIDIGAEAIIGANAVVVTDVPPRTTMVGVPARPLPPKSDPH